MAYAIILKKNSNIKFTGLSASGKCQGKVSELSGIFEILSNVREMSGNFGIYGGKLYFCPVLCASVTMTMAISVLYNILI
jgi:hypothetical protein